MSKEALNIRPELPFKQRAVLRLIFIAGAGSAFLTACDNANTPVDPINTSAPTTVEVFPAEVVVEPTSEPTPTEEILSTPTFELTPTSFPTEIIETREPLEIIEFMANGEMVEGRVIEVSELWDGEIPSDFYYPGGYHVWGSEDFDSGLRAHVVVFGFLRQWRVVEFDLQDGSTVRQMLVDMGYANNNGQETVVRFRFPDIDFASSWSPFVSNPRLGARYRVVLIYMPLGNTTTSQDLVDYSLGQADSCATPERCALVYGGTGDIKFSESELKNILDGKEGEFVDLSDSTALSNVVAE